MRSNSNVPAYVTAFPGYARSRVPTSAAFDTASRHPRTLGNPSKACRWNHRRSLYVGDTADGALMDNLWQPPPSRVLIALASA